MIPLRHLLMGVGDQIFALDLPVGILAKPAASADKALCCLSVALELPIEPAHRDGCLTAPVCIQESSSVADVKVGDEYRHGADLFEIIHAILICDVGRSTENVNDGRMQLLKGCLGDRNTRNGIAVRENPAAMDHDGADARIAGYFERLQAAATPTGDRNPLRIDPAVIRTALPQVLRQRPINGLN